MHWPSRAPHSRVRWRRQSRTLFFTDLRIHTDDDAGNEGNFGLGLRRMYASGWDLGAYAYDDRKRTEFGNYFNQATLSLETLGRDFEFCASSVFSCRCLISWLTSVT